MPITTRKPKRKAATRSKKRKCKVVVKESVKVRSKGAKTDSAKALPIAPMKVPDNGVTFKVKLKRK